MWFLSSLLSVLQQMGWHFKDLSGDVYPNHPRRAIFNTININHPYSHSLYEAIVWVVENIQDGPIDRPWRAHSSVILWCPGEVSFLPPLDPSANASSPITSTMSPPSSFARKDDVTASVVGSIAAAESATASA